MEKGKEIKIEIAESKCKETPKDREFQDFFQTKRQNNLPQKVDVDFSEHK